MIITPKVVGLRQISWVIRDNYSQGRGSATNLVLKNNQFNPFNPLFPKSRCAANYDVLMSEVE